jgi:hypothetical protein
VYCRLPKAEYRRLPIAERDQSADNWPSTIFRNLQSGIAR